MDVSNLTRTHRVLVPNSGRLSAAQRSSQPCIFQTIESPTACRIKNAAGHTAQSQILRRGVAAITSRYCAVNRYAFVGLNNIPSAHSANNVPPGVANNAANAGTTANFRADGTSLRNFQPVTTRKADTAEHPSTVPAAIGALGEERLNWPASIDSVIPATVTPATKSASTPPNT